MALARSLAEKMFTLAHWFPTWGKLPKLGNGAFWFGQWAVRFLSVP